MQEVILTSDFTDATRMREIILEGKSRMQGQMISGGHSVAVNRAMSYGSASGEISEQISGIPFYRLVCSLAEEFDAKELADKMNTLANFIFRKENLMVDFIGTAEGYEELVKYVPAFADSLYKGEVKKQADNIEVSRKNEEFPVYAQAVPSSVPSQPLPFQPCFPSLSSPGLILWSLSTGVPWAEVGPPGCPEPV